MHCWCCSWLWKFTPTWFWSRVFTRLQRVLMILISILYSLQPKLVKPDSEDSEMAQPGTDWQVSKKSLRDRIAVMWNRELLADIHFIVGSDSTTQRRIPAHKFILATASPVFYAMFYGVLAGDTKEVTIPDVEPQAFLKMLRWVYGRKIKVLWQHEIWRKCIDS